MWPTLGREDAGEDAGGCCVVVAEEIALPADRDTEEDYGEGEEGDAEEGDGAEAAELGLLVLVKYWSCEVGETYSRVRIAISGLIDRHPLNQRRALSSARPRHLEAGLVLVVGAVAADAARHSHLLIYG